MKKLCFLVRCLSSSCLQKHKYSYLTAAIANAPTTLQSQFHLLNLSNPSPYFCIPTLPFSTQVSTATTSTSTSTSRKPVAIYLVERLGFSEEQSLAISKKLVRLRDNASAKHVQVTDKISFEKSDNIITFLQEYCGLDLSQVKKVVTKHPRVLAADLDKTIKPKVKLLLDLGFSTSDLAHVLSRNPKSYLSTDLSPAIQALRDLMGSDDKAVVKVFKGCMYGNTSNILSNLIPNVTILENEYGITRDKIRKFRTQAPKLIIARTEWLRDVLARMEDKWGISRDSSEFLRAVHVFCCLSDEKINSKCQAFRSYGWSDSDILSLIRRYPNCLCLSEATIKKKLEFYMNELGYKPAYMASRTALFSLSLENRVVPRHRVLTILKEKGLFKVDYQLYTAIAYNEDRFLNNFIIPYEGVVPNLREVFVNSRVACETMPGGKTSEVEAHQQSLE